MRLKPTLYALVAGLGLGCTSDPASGPVGTTSASTSTTAAVQDDDSGNGSTGVPDLPPLEFCGNNVVGDQEVCDGTDLASNTCQDHDFDTGELACDATCTGFNLEMCRDFDCGDQMTEGSEQCDGGVGEATCVSEGFDSGVLDCAATCEFDTSGCGTCGNMIIDAAEDCDIKASLTQSCNTLGFTTGVLECSADCLFDTARCSTCGNNISEELEGCDGTDVLGETCLSLSNADAGTLSCAEDCSAIDTSGCTFLSCGDDLVQGDETCDGVDLNGATCANLGEDFDAGVLTCAANCMAFDTSACTNMLGPCCVANGTPECQNVACSAAVCAIDPFCCSNTWDGACANVAMGEPACAGVGGCP